MTVCRNTNNKAYDSHAVSQSHSHTSHTSCEREFAGAVVGGHVAVRVRDLVRRAYSVRPERAAVARSLQGQSWENAAENPASVATMITTKSDQN